MKLLKRWKTKRIAIKRAQHENTIKDLIEKRSDLARKILREEYELPEEVSRRIGEALLYMGERRDRPLRLALGQHRPLDDKSKRLARATYFEILSKVQSRAPELFPKESLFIIR